MLTTQGFFTLPKFKLQLDKICIIHLQNHRNINPYWHHRKALKSSGPCVHQGLNLPHDYHYSGVQQTPKNQPSKHKGICFYIILFPASVDSEPIAPPSHFQQHVPKQCTKALVAEASTQNITRHRYTSKASTLFHALCSYKRLHINIDMSNLLKKWLTS